MIKIKIYLILFIIVVFSGCHNKEYEYNNFKSIMKKEDSYVYNLANINTSKEVSNISFDKFDGRFSLYEISELNNQEVEISYDVNIDEGLFKIVIVSDTKVTTVCEGSDKGIKIFSLSEGKSIIKIIGSKARGKFKLHVNSDNIKVIKS